MSYTYEDSEPSPRRPNNHKNDERTAEQKLFDEIARLQEQDTPVSEMIQPLVDLADADVEVLEHLLVGGANSVISRYFARVRRSIERPIWSEPESEPWKPDAKAAQRIGIETRYRRSVWEYPLPGGKPLGEATHEDLEEAIRHHQALVTGNQRSVEMYARFDAILVESGKRKLKNAMSEDDAEDIVNNRAS